MKIGNAVRHPGSPHVVYIGLPNPTNDLAKALKLKPRLGIEGALFKERPLSAHKLSLFLEFCIGKTAIARSILRDGKWGPLRLERNEKAEKALQKITEVALNDLMKNSFGTFGITETALPKLLEKVIRGKK